MAFLSQCEGAHILFSCLLSYFQTSEQQQLNRDCGCSLYDPLEDTSEVARAGAEGQNSTIANHLLHVESQKDCAASEKVC